MQPPIWPSQGSICRAEPCLCSRPCTCRYEAAQLPETMVSTLDTAAFDQDRTSYVSSHSTKELEFGGLRPEWLESFVADFAALRHDIDW